MTRIIFTPITCAALMAALLIACGDSTGQPGDAGTTDGAPVDGGGRGVDGGGQGSDGGGQGSDGGGSDMPASCTTDPCPCTSDAQCSGDDRCYGPADPPGYGFCPNDCGTDADCASSTRGDVPGICQPSGMICGMGSGICMPGCATDTDCGPGLSCGADHHCGPKSCTADTDCPDQFICGASNDAGRTCARQACGTNADCTRGGTCVNATCQPGIGSCLSQPI
jgi:hypothetical protein